MIRDSKFSVLRTLGAVALCALFGAPAMAQVPDLVPYQGYLTDDAGNPYAGDSVSLTFRVYADADSPGAIWTEQWNDVPVFDGVFYAYLGMTMPIADVLASGNARYLGVSIAGVGEAAPRQRMGSVPYALMARDASSLQGYAAEDFTTRGEMGNYARWDQLDGRGYATREWVEGYVDDNASADPEVFATRAWLLEQGYATQDWVREWAGEQGYATQDWVREWAAEQGYLGADALEGYATEDWVRGWVGDQGYLGADALEGYASQQWVRDQGYATEDWVRGWVGEQGYLGADALDGYATEAWVRDQGYLNEAALNGYATEAWVREQGYLDAGALDAYATEQWVQEQGYLDAAALEPYATEGWVLGLGYLTEAAIEQLAYATTADVDALRADVSQNYVTDEALDARGYIDADDLAGLGYATAADVAALQARISALEEALEGVAASASAFVLGRSSNASDGGFSFEGRTGTQAATRMCQTTYPNEPTAHFCTPDEVVRALATDSLSDNARATIGGEWMWTVGNTPEAGRGNSSQAGNCYNLLYDSGDIASGTRLMVTFDSAPRAGQVAGDYVTIQQSVGCNNSYRVLCCR